MEIKEEIQSLDDQADLNKVSITYNKISPINVYFFL